MISSKEIVLVLIFIFLIPSVYGISITVSSSDGETTSSATTIGAVDFSDAFKQTIKVQPRGLLSSASSGTGTMPEQSHFISDDAGNVAWVSAKVVGSSSTTWSYDWKTSQSSTLGEWVKAEEWLSASNAYSISAMGNAQNSEGDYVQADATVIKGSISGYYVEATATPIYASVSQKADTASGYSIEFSEYARNAENDWVNSDTKIKDGTISMSSPTIPGFSATAIAKGTYAQVDILNLKASSPTGWISQSIEARNVFDSSSVSLGVDKGYIYNYPYSTSYPSKGYASGYYDKTSATQSAYMKGATAKSNAFASISNPVTNPPAKSKSTKDTNTKVKVGDKASTSSTGYSASASHLA
jgi:hypothetical protein